MQGGATKTKHQELAIVVHQLSTGRARGIDWTSVGILLNVYAKLWKQICMFFKWSINNEELPTSCTRAVLPLLPKKKRRGN